MKQNRDKEGERTKRKQWHQKCNGEIKQRGLGMPTVIGYSLLEQFGRGRGIEDEE